MTSARIFGYSSEFLINRIGSGANSEFAAAPLSSGLSWYLAQSEIWGEYRDGEADFNMRAKPSRDALEDNSGHFQATCLFAVNYGGAIFNFGLIFLY
jgi:hypothetical protein